MAMGRRLPQFRSLLSQQALRTDIPKPRTLPTPHSRFLHSSPPAVASRSPLSYFPWRSSGSAGTLLPVSAAAVEAAARAAAKRWLAARAAGSLELFSLQRKGSSRCPPSPSTSPRRGLWERFIPSADGAVLMLMVANVAVYMLWQKADPGFMRNHFTVSDFAGESQQREVAHAAHQRAFSHAEPRYLFNNMMCLFFFGSTIPSSFGPAFLSKLYIAGALVGSTFYLVEKAFAAPGKQGHVEGDSSRTSGLGASAAVNAIFFLYTFLNPKGRVYLYFLIPVPAASLGVCWIALDLWRVREGEMRASGFFHFGGTVVAALCVGSTQEGLDLIIQLVHGANRKVCVDVDATLFPNELRTGWGAVIRDASGAFLLAVAEGMHGLSTAELAATEHIRRALTGAANNGFKDIVLASDCLSMV
ncbi:hypothetical protein ACQ4PT_043408 [Festuca glaucescens]